MPTHLRGRGWAWCALPRLLCACLCNKVPLQVFFCIVGTLVAAAVIVHEGDYTGYHKSLAQRSAQDAKD